MRSDADHQLEGVLSEGSWEMWRLKRINPDSFSGKLYLLVVDKLILGAFIAAAFVAYDQWKTHETRRYTEVIQKVQYLKELVPIVASSENDLLVRAQALVALIDRKAIDARTAFALTERLLRSGLTFSERTRDEGGVYLHSHEEDFLSNTLLEFMPGALPALLDHYLVSSFPGSMDFERQRSTGDGAGDRWRYRQEAPLFWEELVAKVVNHYSDSELALLDGDRFLSQYLFALSQAARHPSLRLSGRRVKGLRILHSIDVLSRPNEGGVDSKLVTRLQQEAAEYLLSLTARPLIEDRRNVVKDVAQLLRKLPPDRREAAQTLERMTQAINKSE